MSWLWFRRNILGQHDDLPGNKLKPLYEGDRGLEDLHANDAELRVWVPEPVKVAMQEVAEKLDVALSKYLRDLFVVYLYGVHELLCMQDNQTGIFHPKPPPPARAPDAPMFSRAYKVDYIPGLGKNIVPIKMFLPQKMKEDLQGLADKAGIPLSQFVREILVSHFLGHTVWPERKVLWTASQLSIAEGWEQGSIETQWLHSPTQEEEDGLEGKIENLRW